MTLPRCSSKSLFWISNNMPRFSPAPLLFFFCSQRGPRPCQSNSVTEKQCCFLNPSFFQLFHLKISLVPLQCGLGFILNTNFLLCRFPQTHSEGCSFDSQVTVFSPNQGIYFWDEAQWMALFMVRTEQSPPRAGTGTGNGAFCHLSAGGQVACFSVLSAPWASNQAQETAFRCVRQ